MKTLLTIIAVVAFAGIANAQTQGCYGWEDGGLALGEYGIVEYGPTGSGYASEGIYSLAVRETGSGTGQIYGAWIKNLNEGDVVDVSFDVYDDSEGSLYTSTRIWGHYALAGNDINAYDGSASGNSTYSDGLGWNTLSYSWTIPAGKTTLVVEIRPYGASPYDQGFNYVDNICVSVNNDNATIEFPGGTVGSDDGTWSGVKALFR
jgi:hypothetical protein